MVRKVKASKELKIKATTSKEVEKVTYSFNGTVLNLRNVKSGNYKDW